VTVAEALSAIRRVGTVENNAGNLRLRFPETAASELQTAIDTLRSGKAEALALLSDPDSAELARASAVLNRAGIRIMALESGATIGVWSDLDGPEVRAAVRAFGLGGLPVRYLDGAGIPMRYKLRRVEGEPVPMNVLAELERRQADLMEGRDPMQDSGPMEGTDPWTVRDQMLNEMGWCSKSMSWAEWKAAALNRLFLEQGVTGQPGRITTATVRHGERKIAISLRRTGGVGLKSSTPMRRESL
jgi:hypothetical protein